MDEESVLSEAIITWLFNLQIQDWHGNASSLSPYYLDFHHNKSGHVPLQILNGVSGRWNAHSNKIGQGQSESSFAPFFGALSQVMKSSDECRGDRFSIHFLSARFFSFLDLFLTFRGSNPTRRPTFAGVNNKSRLLTATGSSFVFKSSFVYRWGLFAFVSYLFVPLPF